METLTQECSHPRDTFYYTTSNAKLTITRISWAKNTISEFYFQRAVRPASLVTIDCYKQLK